MASTKNEGQDDEKKQTTVFQSGYIKMKQSNADPKIYWAEFRTKSNQLHLFDKEASLNEPEEIIYLSTCNIEETESKKKYIMLKDECTGIRYKFEPHQIQNNPEGWISKINFFIQECIIDVLCQDVSQMNARQQFNRFLLHQRKMAQLQRQQLPKFVQAVEKAESCDAALKDATTWLQRQKLDEDDRQKFGSALVVRNQFWNLLIETRDFLNKDYVSANKICSVFTRWEKMSAKQEKLTDRDKKILIWGLKELTNFIKPEKMTRAEALKDKWNKLGKKITQCQKDLQALRQKWVEKVQEAENIAWWCNLMGGLLAAGGIIGGAIAVWAGAPVWVPCALGGAALLGFGIIIGGNENLKAHKGIKKKIEDMQHHMTSYELAVQQWVEAIELLDFPLGSIAFAASSKDDYQQEFESEIVSWEKIAEHEKELLGKATKTFTKFRDQSLNSLNRIRNVQDKLQL